MKCQHKHITLHSVQTQKKNNYFGLYVVNHAIYRLHRDLHFQFLAQLDVFKGLYIVLF